MTTVSFGGWTVEADREATSRAQSLAGPSGAVSCGCLYCRNFLAAGTAIFPPGLLRFLDEIGVPKVRETRVSELGPSPAGRLYISLFHFVGNILVSGERGNGFEVRPAIYPLPQCFPKGQVLEMSLTLEIPWVLSEPAPA